MECEVAANMGTPGSGRKRAPIKDRFSAEDEALSSIAREVRVVHLQPLLISLVSFCGWRWFPVTTIKEAFTEKLTLMLLLQTQAT